MSSREGQAWGLGTAWVMNAALTEEVVLASELLPCRDSGGNMHHPSPLPLMGVLGELWVR